LAAFLAVFVQSLSAQAVRALPAHANLADGQHSMDMPFGRAGFRTQILVDSTAVASSGAVLTGVRFRADRWSIPAFPATVPNVTVSVSHSTVAVASMATQFAGNVTGAATVVFQGSVTLPGHFANQAGPFGWDIVVPFSAPYPFTSAQGNLLIDIVGNNAAYQWPPVCWLDAMQGGGTGLPFGVQGSTSVDRPLLEVATSGSGSGLQPRRVAPGFALDFRSWMFFSTPPGYLALGVSVPSTPVSLAAMGAPGNTLYIDPLVTFPHTWIGPTPHGAWSTHSLAVPANPLLIGVMLYGQSVMLDPAANALGLGLSNAVEVRLGDPAEVLPMRQISEADPLASGGWFQDFNQTGIGPPEYGAVPILLEGVFF
jgi:hypothetical protein